MNFRKLFNMLVLSMGIVVCHSPQGRERYHKEIY